MLKIASALNSLAGALVSLVVLAILGTGAWMGLRAYWTKWERDELAGKLAERQAEVDKLNRDLKARGQEIVALNKDLEAKRREIVRLETALRLLKVDHRVAQIDVISQQGLEKEGNLVTAFTFTEMDDKGNPLEKPRPFAVKGDTVYVEALVVKFADASVEAGDPLRATSLCLFQRVFGRHQQPADGFVLDPVGAQPVPYRSGREVSDFEKEIWARFWEYANNRAKAEEKGIRAAHGEAPFQRLVPGKRYKVTLRSSGGLSFMPEDAPPRSGGQAF